MKVGGTPMQRAERLFLCASMPLDKLPVKVFAKGGAPAAALSDAQRSKRLARAREVALVECKALAVVESLGAIVEDTHHWVEKKLAQNYEELKQDMEREDFDIGGDDSDEEVRPVLCFVLLTGIVCHHCLIWCPSASCPGVGRWSNGTWLCYPH